MIYTRTLTQKFRKVYFILPFPYIKGDIDVKINMKNLYKMKANVTVNNKQISEKLNESGAKFSQWQKGIFWML